MNLNFSDKVLCVGVKCRALGSSLTDHEATAELLENKGATDGALVKKERLKQATASIRQIQAKARNYVRSETLPGIAELRLTPASRLERIQKQIAIYQGEQDAAVAKLVEEYPTHLEKERERLGDLFDPALYPTYDMLSSLFSIQLIVTDMPKGEYERVVGLNSVAKQAMEDAHQKMLAEIGVAARNEVFRKMTELIQKIADKMGDPDAKRYYDATFDNLKEYLGQVPALNITNDPVLEEMRAAAAKHLDYKMSVVKESEFLKSQAKQAAQRILRTFGNSAGSRKLMSA